MKASPALLVAAAVFAAPAFAQSDAQCILAGRLSDGQWAPHFETVRLLDAGGQQVFASDKATLAGVKRVSLSTPALLSKCDGDQALFNGDNEAAGRKTEVPALARGSVDVEGVSFPKLRTGGELVELRVRVPADRVVMLTR